MITGVAGVCADPAAKNCYGARFTNAYTDAHGTVHGPLCAGNAECCPSGKASAPDQACESP